MGCRRQRASVRIDERRGAGCEFRRQGANRAARKLPQRPQGAPEPLRSPRLAAAHAKALRARASQRHSTPTQRQPRIQRHGPPPSLPPTLPTRPHRSSSISSHIHVESKAAQTRASWLTGGLSQRQSTPQATPSFGQSRPIGRLGARPVGRAVGIAHRRRQGRGLFSGELPPTDLLLTRSPSATRPPSCRTSSPWACSPSSSRSASTDRSWLGVGLESELGLGLGLGLVLGLGSTLALTRRLHPSPRPTPN